MDTYIRSADFNPWRVFWKHIPELPPELPAGEAVDGEVDEAVEDGAELDNVVEDDCGVTGHVAVPLCLRKGGNCDKERCLKKV